MLWSKLLTSMLHILYKSTITVYIKGTENNMAVLLYLYKLLSDPRLQLYFLHDTFYVLWVLSSGQRMNWLSTELKKKSSSRPCYKSGRITGFDHRPAGILTAGKSVRHTRIGRVARMGKIAYWWESTLGKPGRKWKANTKFISRR
jgi:hypothetical protein